MESATQCTELMEKHSEVCGFWSWKWISHMMSLLRFDMPHSPCGAPWVSGRLLETGEEGRFRLKIHLPGIFLAWVRDRCPRLMQQQVAWVRICHQDCGWVHVSLSAVLCRSLKSRLFREKVPGLGGNWKPGYRRCFWRARWCASRVQVHESERGDNLLNHRR